MRKGNGAPYTETIGLSTSADKDARANAIACLSTASSNATGEFKSVKGLEKQDERGMLEMEIGILVIINGNVVWMSMSALANPYMLLILFIRFVVQLVSLQMEELNLVKPTL